MVKGLVLIPKHLQPKEVIRPGGKQSWQKVDSAGYGGWARSPQQGSTLSHLVQGRLLGRGVFDIGGHVA